MVTYIFQNPKGQDTYVYIGMKHAIYSVERI